MTSSLSDPQNANRATPTIEAANATLHIGSSTFIAAPSTAIWAALTNTSTWPSWNEFVPRVTIRSQPNTESNIDTELSPILQRGTKMTFHVRMDPTSTKPQKATDTQLVVTEFEAPNPETNTAGRIVWASDSEAPGGFSASLLTAEREHEIKDVEGGTEVRNWENQVGWLVYAVKWMYGKRLERNFDLWVEDLKRFVEGE
ncbi:hypothetical protein N7520_003849 [Penicillium odoratum]|uniref:uncharacterized protein n=1 Tax=Penicillium odoratum TaxID=1167516 RepID=UPI00254811D2|nr:uncharacterized protein N7520_003849 [Penicillium odoratum]KAJ5769290.1 hypothetical protein N7520_003849 [Penicillium odoratum]